jgi:Co/Zn/Cd efflux system component
VIAGISGHSVALLADAGHNLSDVLGLLVAWVATLLEAWFAPASINGKRFTYYSSIKVKPPALPNTSSTEE